MDCMDVNQASDNISIIQNFSDRKITCQHFPDLNPVENSCSKKRAQVESSSGTKACREKMRRERLNDRFSELCCFVEPGKPLSTDKVVILRSASNFLNQLRLEAQKYTEKVESLQDTIKCLKAEKMELREEKLKLKAEKERMEELLKCLSIPSPSTNCRVLPCLVNLPAGQPPTCQ